jgi:hypothetical protein
MFSNLTAHDLPLLFNDRQRAIDHGVWTEEVEKPYEIFRRGKRLAQSLRVGTSKPFYKVAWGTSSG